MPAARRAFKIIAVLVLFILIASLYAVLYIIPDISENLRSTYVVNEKILEIGFNKQALVIRDETVYFSDQSGTVSTYALEGEKTRIGTKIADIYTGSEKVGIYCEKTGFVSYFYDGYESIINSTNIVLQDPAVYLNYEASPVSLEPAYADKGSFLYKLVDGTAWYIVFSVDETILENFTINKKVVLELGDGTLLNGIVERILGRDSLAVMVRVTTYYPDFCGSRYLDVHIISDTYEGLCIPASAVAYEDGNPGAYVIGVDGNYSFVRINMLINQDNYIIISEDEFSVTGDDGEEITISSLSLYDEILKNADEYSR